MLGGSGAAGAGGSAAPVGAGTARGSGGEVPRECWAPLGVAVCTAAGAAGCCSNMRPGHPDRRPSAARREAERPPARAECRPGPSGVSALRRPGLRRSRRRDQWRFLVSRPMPWLDEGSDSNLADVCTLRRIAPIQAEIRHDRRKRTPVQGQSEMGSQGEHQAIAEHSPRAPARPDQECEAQARQPQHTPGGEISSQQEQERLEIQSGHHRSPLTG